MKILYMGPLRPETTSRHRADALRRLGCEALHIDLAQWFESELSHPFFGRIHYRTGYRFLQRRIHSRLASEIPITTHFDIAWVNGGELFGPGAVRYLSGIAERVILYNNDDPTGNRDLGRWFSLRAALPEYDLCAVLRKPNVEEYLTRGASKVLRVWMSYDEIVHRPFDNRREIGDDYRSEVLFVGTWMEKRDRFLRELIERGVPLTIRGSHWHRCPNRRFLKDFCKPVATARHYVRAIQGAKICLGLLSKGNRDLHTRRSAEIPYAGGLLCAERTPEHLDMYREGEQALFWSDAEECARVCHELLADDEKRERIRQAGRRRVLALKIGNEDICRQILLEVEALNESTVMNRTEVSNGRSG